MHGARPERSSMRQALASVVFAFTVGSVGCKPSPIGATVTEMGILPQSSTIKGRDGGQSGVAFGHSIWAYGDTILNEADELGTNWHHNSFSITDDLNARDGIGGFVERTDSVGAPQYFIAPSADEATFNAAHLGDSCAEKPCGARFAVWPGAPVWDAARDRALIFYGLIYAEPGAFNFHGVGQSVAVWNSFDSAPARPEVSPTAAHPTLLFAEGEPAWGNGAVIEGDDLYAFACDSDTDSFSPPCSLARVAAADVLNRNAWRFYDGSIWTNDMRARQTLFTGAPTISIEHNAYLGEWTAIYAEPLSNDVMMRTSPELTGPWSEARLLFVANKPDEGAYDANVHPEYEEQGGKVLYVTFSRSNHQGWFGSEMALVRVTLPERAH